jgi:cell shape-determining protein MreC
MREFLRGLELDEETIDTIMAEVGKGYTKLKEQVDDLKTQNLDYQSQIKELNGKIETDTESLKNLETVTNENKDLKAQLQMSGSNVKKEFSKFVTSEVMSNVNDDTDFATALENYKKDNPQYFGDTVVKKVQSSPTLAGGQQPTSTNDIMNNILRSATQNN